MIRKRWVRLALQSISRFFQSIRRAKEEKEDGKNQVCMWKDVENKVRKRVSRTLCPTFPGMRVSAQRGASPKEKDTVTSARPTYRRHRSVCTSQCPSAAVPRSTLRCCREKKKNKKRKKKRGNQYLDRSLCAVGHQMKMRGNTSHSSRRALKANLENRESSVAEILCSSFIRRLSPRWDRRRRRMEGAKINKYVQPTNSLLCFSLSFGDAVPFVCVALVNTNPGHHLTFKIVGGAPLYPASLTVSVLLLFLFHFARVSSRSGRLNRRTC